MLFNPIELRAYFFFVIEEKKMNEFLIFFVPLLEYKEETRKSFLFFVYKYPNFNT
jgi:hypothetical protein